MKLKPPKPLMAAATSSGEPVKVNDLVVGFTSTPPPWARELDEGPNAVPSVEKKLLEVGESGFVVIIDGVPKTDPLLAINPPPPPPLLPREDVLPLTVPVGDTPPVTVPDIIAPPPLLDVTVDPPPPPLTVLCPLVTPDEDRVPVTSEACATKEKAKIKASTKNDFNNIWFFIFLN